MKFFAFCYNSTPHTSFNCEYTPFQLIFGRNSNLPQELCQGNIDPIYNHDSYVKELKFRLQQAYKRAQDLLEKSKIVNKNQFDKHAKPLNLNLNDKVVLINENRTKFEPMYSGPYLVTKINIPNVEIYDINLRKVKVVHMNNIRKYFN